MSISSIIDDLISGSGLKDQTHDADSVKNAFTSKSVDPFKKHTEKMGNRAVFDEVSEEFTGGKVGSGRLKNLNSIVGEIKEDNDSKSLIEDLFELTGGPSKQELRADAKRVKKIADNADSLFKGIHKEVNGHAEAIEVLKTDLGKVKKDVNEAFAKAKLALREAKGPAAVKIAGEYFAVATPEERAKSLKILNDNHEATLNHLKDEFKTRLEVHELAITEMKDLSSKIEEVSGVKNKYGFSKPSSSLGQEAGALEKGAANAGKELEAGAKAGFGTGLAIVGASTALGGVVGHQFDKDGSQSMTFAGGAIGAIGGFLAKNKIANLLGMAAHAR